MQASGPQIERIKGIFLHTVAIYGQCRLALKVKFYAPPVLLF